MNPTLAPARPRNTLVDLPAAPPLRAAVYVRISDDKRGDADGVAEQERTCRALVEREGWELVEIFTDNDKSAYSGKPRPAYRRLMGRLAAGDFDVVVARHPERLHRRPIELEEWIDVQERVGATVRTVKEGLWDLSTPGGRLSARILGAVAAHESEHKADRIRDRMEANARQGRAHGPLRSFGYTGTRRDDGRHDWVIQEDEADVIREAARRVLEGESYTALAKEFAARGVIAIKGGPVTHQLLRRVLISTRVAGWTTHNPNRAELDNGAGAPYDGGPFVAVAEWPAILDRATVERLRRKLANPERRNGPQGRSYLLSGGLAVCGRCGSNLRGKPNKGRAYSCSSGNNGGTPCGGLSVRAEPLEAFVIEAVRQAHDSGRFTGAVQARALDSGADEAWARVEALRGEDEALAADYAAGDISRNAWAIARDGLRARLAAAERDWARARETESSALLVGGVDEFDRAWSEDEAAGNVSGMRARLAAALDAVHVDPAIVGAPRTFDHRRVRLSWRA